MWAVLKTRAPQFTIVYQNLHCYSDNDEPISIILTIIFITSNMTRL